MEIFIDKILYIYKKNLNIDKGKQEVLRFAIRLVISTFLGYSLTIIVALILKNLWYVLPIMIVVSIFRAFSGGAHCSNMFNCAVFSAGIMNILGLIAKLIVPSKELIITMILAVFIFSVWSINKYAPADTPGKPINSKVKKEKLRKFSFSFVILWYGFSISWYLILNEFNFLTYVMAYAILWQSFTLMPVGYKFTHFVDKLISFHKYLGT